MSLICIILPSDSNPHKRTEPSARGTANLITRPRYVLWKLVSLKRQLSLRLNKADPHLHYKRGQAEPFQRRHLDCFLFSLSRFVLRHKTPRHNDLWRLTAKLCQSHNVHLGGEPSRCPHGVSAGFCHPVSPQQREGRAIKFLSTKGDIPAEREGSARIWHNLKHGCHILNGRPVSLLLSGNFFCSSYWSMTASK